ncbi:MAG: DUF3598 family protein [Cyanobacteria bacterium J06627_28]
MRSQWECLQQNIGIWHGAFLQFSPEGTQVKETPSVLTLKETEPDQTIELILEREPDDGPKKVNRLTFNAPGPAPATYFFEEGSFSQGASQWSAFGQFPTEFSLKVGDRRVRFVVMYESTQRYTSQVKYVTLICETQTDGTQFVDDRLTATQLAGSCEGTATVFDSRTGDFLMGESHWRFDDELSLVSKEQFSDGEHSLVMSGLRMSGAHASETCLALQPKSDDELVYQLMLLPKGAYCLLPQEIKREKAFRIEVGWVSEDGARSRFIRYYDTRGVWTNSALISDSLKS